MGNIEIIGIVFGSSAFIVIILIIAFRWLGININRCWKSKTKKMYMPNDINKMTHDFNRNDETKVSKSMNSYSISSQIWNSERALSLISNNTVDTFDNFNESIANNAKPISVQLKPNLKHMTICNNQILNSYDNNILDENQLDVSFIQQNYGKLQLEINYNAYEILYSRILKLIKLIVNKNFYIYRFEQYLEIQIVQAKDVKQMFAELDKIENQTMLKNSCCYLVVWVNNDYVNRQKSEVR